MIKNKHGDETLSTVLTKAKATSYGRLLMMAFLQDITYLALTSNGPLALMSTSACVKPQSSRNMPFRVEADQLLDLGL